MCYHPMAAYQCPFDPNLIFYTKDDLVLHCKQNHILCKLCDTMSVNQASLEEHYRRRHPKSPPQKVQPAVQVQQMSQNQNKWNQAKVTKPKHNRNHSQTSQTWQLRKMFALFMAQPASTLVTYARNHSAQ